MNLEHIISEAKFCASNIAVSYAKAAGFGDNTDEMYFNLLRINAYIRTLERNRTVIKRQVKKIPIENQTITFSMLKKKNSFLTLETKEKTFCEEIKSEPCLTDSELQLIIEQVKLLCSSCNCNCN
jgi:hypothetical protein